MDGIVLPFGQKSPARATTEVRLASNLDASAEALGTITQSSALRATAQAGDRIQTLFDSRGQSLGVSDNDVLRVRYAATDTARVTDLANSSGAAIDLANGDTIVVSDGSSSANLTFDSTWTLGDLAAGPDGARVPRHRDRRAGERGAGRRAALHEPLGRQQRRRERELSSGAAPCSTRSRARFP